LLSVLLLAIPLAVHLAPKPWRKERVEDNGDGTDGERG
jgi:hypothetical protein